ncbi:5-methylthioadenosine/S-adenosylhomocysteine deaminase 2 [Desulfamplus magnetovallimortis]|uniref:5-methylthioadenosine/S-adenosylhomocysteine deaminase 2 n=1 Tax=Desulfamplus magnetovallimortis TaxID=1246637 RepID=A0A1W1HB08_9BACT|nr:amidohydrolase [Desulfamplus magnetovallimortis]SLM29602.1 5-methylthioadenosine/S-adenosylhomocysteine deaminase 2 [Desulfamplus magnetovallimortis]
MKNSILIINGLLLTMEQEMPLVEDGAIFIKDGIIVDCGTSREIAKRHGRVETVIDAESHIIMPGLVNCHTHLPMSMFRGLADDLPLDVWLNEHIFPAEAAMLNPDSVKKWALHSCMEMLLAGITTCCDGYFYEDQVAEAVMASGMRAVLGQGVIDFPAPGVPEPAKNIDVAEDFVRKWKSFSSTNKSYVQDAGHSRIQDAGYSRVVPSVFCHSPYTCSRETLIKAKEMAKRLGVLFQIHVAETREEMNMVRRINSSISGDESRDMSVVQYLDSAGILDDKTLLVHAVWINDADMEIIKSRSAKVAHCPESNMKLASGIAPAWKLVQENISVGLGTDGCASNNTHDLFSEMDMAAKLQKTALMDPCAMDARSVVEMATIGGARAIGLGHITGSIVPGKKADIIVVGLRKPHMVPVYNPWSTVVYGAKASDVRVVMVDGTILVKDGKFLNPDFHD